MRSNRDKRLTCWALVVIFILTAGCTLSSYHTHPESIQQTQSIKHPVLLMSDVHIYQMTSDGMATLRNDWSAVGRQNLQNALSQNLKSSQCDLRPLVTNSEITRQIEEIRSLYKLVHKSMDQQAFGPTQTDSPGFKFCLGSIKDILQESDADSAIFVTGYDKVSAGRHKSMIDLAIADSSGTILYYSVRGTIKGNDLRDPESAHSMVRELLAGFSKAEG